jgi:putative transcriptional regulator
MPRYDHERLSRLRAAKGMSLQQLADAIGRSPATVARYETGRINPTVLVLGDIARVLDVSVDDLFDPNDPTDPVTAFAAEIGAMVEAAPPFTDEQKSRLRVLLRGAV